MSSEGYLDLGIWPDINFFCPTIAAYYFSEKIIWCLESIHFPIQAVIKPQTKHVLNDIWLTWPQSEVYRSHEFMEQIAPYRRFLKVLQYNAKKLAKCRIMQIVCGGKLLRFLRICLQSRKFPNEFFFLIIRHFLDLNGGQWTRL